ncbi:LacI family DNA-binding transcriptional regulator [uncultured Treponema sp.]|uniref:LacI family DNA-binding transcriptional regulator n=1 Tax=uncultured Treponema sp. TaxID=162155 RepID=UPI0025ED0880|nr:LacI family DNA-binding transcriptional regulator [uncultured Treponema sp.]
MVTLKDIARECKVSFSTVSKALKGSPEIGLETTEFVRKKAREMGYHPNLAARTLRTNRTYDIGVIFEEKTGVGLQHEYFATVVSGIQSVAFKKGYDITFIGGNSLQNYDYHSHARARSYDGVAILSCDFSSSGIIDLIKSEIPTVTLDFALDAQHSAVLSDTAAGIEELCEYVISMGHRKIAMIHGEKTWVTDQRVEAFKKTCEKHGISIPDDYFAEVLYHDTLGCSVATKKLLSLNEPPTCIFYPDDYAALGGIYELRGMNLTPGKDISIVGYDGINLTSMMVPPLTTYEQNGKVAGQTMAEFLFALIEDSARSKPKHEFINGRLIQGGTVVKIN